MGLWLDTSGKASRAIAICGRCAMKMALSDMVEDGDKPGLRVCPECRDDIDPWRLPAPSPDNITLQYPRPDEPLSA